jgi:hypothetical protein
MLDYDKVKDDIRDKLREHTSKYTYYLIALSVAAIGFSVNIALNLKLNWWQLPLGLSIISWAISIILGFTQIESNLYILSISHFLADVVSGNNDVIGNDATKIKLGRDISINAMKVKANIADKAGTRQKKLLYTGMIFFIIWCIIKMYINNTIQLPVTK